jgi:hypothetical protein
VKDEAVIDGALVDVRNVNQHKCVRLIVDVPAERAREVIEVSVAIARLTEQASQAPRQVSPLAPAGAPKSYAQRIALLCKEPRFWRFMEERGWIADSEDSAADAVRAACGVKSRSEIVEGGEAGHVWRNMSADYDNWKRS